MAEQLVLRGTLEGHSGWVTSLATSLEKCVEEISRLAHTVRAGQLRGSILTDG